MVDGVQLFRVETDSAWKQMLDIQLKVLPPGEPQQNPFRTFLRHKRQAALPAWCICQPVRQCPPGPQGPPGDPGPDGRK